MRLLWTYLARYRGLLVLALVLATINQVFSLLDPLIFRHVIDEYATRYREYTTGQFFRGVSLLLLAAVGVAFVSRVAKNFQDYCINVITQRLGAQPLDAAGVGIDRADAEPRRGEQQRVPPAPARHVQRGAPVWQEVCVRE